MFTFTAETSPDNVGRRVATHFADCEPDCFAPKGYDGASMRGSFIPYPISVLWANAIETSRLIGDTDLNRRLSEEFVVPFLPNGAKNGKCPDPCHVDLSVFGSVMCEAYLSSHDGETFSFGRSYVERQWAEPREDDYAKLPESMRGGGHTVDFVTRKTNFAAGLSGQSRFWTDDMFMIGYLQTRGAMAYDAFGDHSSAAKCINRAAVEAARYVKCLQLRDGEHSGLFYHAQVAPQVWGRGNGWMAAGLAVVLDNLSPLNPNHADILAGYRKMMAALLRFQRPNGMWGQLVDNAASWDESSATAIFTYALIRGVKRGWLDADAYEAAAMKAWNALCGKMDANANLSGVCAGTDIGKTAEHYLSRPRVTGAPHGQAGLLLCANAFLAN